MADIVLSVISIAKQVKDCCDLVKANKEQCRFIGARVSILSTQVEKIRALPSEVIHSKTQGLQQLEGALKSALVQVSKYTKDPKGVLSGLQRLVQSNRDSEQFEELHKSLDQSSSDLSLVCAFGAAQDAALKEDQQSQLVLPEARKHAECLLSSYFRAACLL